MRTLLEIIESAKDGQMPTHEECYWAMLALSGLHYFDHSALINFIKLNGVARNTKLVMEFQANESLHRFQMALGKSPKDFVGPKDDPANPAYQRFRAWGKRLIDKIEKDNEKPANT